MIYPVLQPHYSAATHPPSLRHPFPEPSIRPLEFHPNFRKRPPRSRGFWWDPDVVWWRMEKALYYVISAESAIKSVLGDEVLKRHGSRPGLIDGLGWVIRRGGGGYCGNPVLLFFCRSSVSCLLFSSPPACCKLFYCSIASFTATEAGEGKQTRERGRERRRACARVFNSEERRTPRLITAACLSLSLEMDSVVTRGRLARGLEERLLARDYPSHAFLRRRSVRFAAGRYGTVSSWWIIKQDWFAWKGWGEEKKKTQTTVS